MVTQENSSTWIIMKNPEHKGKLESTQIDKHVQCQMQISKHKTCIALVFWENAAIKVCKRSHQ